MGIMLFNDWVQERDYFAALESVSKWEKSKGKQIAYYNTVPQLRLPTIKEMGRTGVAPFMQSLAWEMNIGGLIRQVLPAHPVRIIRGDLPTCY